MLQRTPYPVLAALGTTTHRGVCLQVREPVSGIDPFGMIRHPGLTLTVAEPHRFAATVHDCYGPDRLRDGDSVPA